MKTKEIGKGKKKVSLALKYDNAYSVGTKLNSEGDKIGLFILLGLETGMRCGDLLSLEKKNFYIDDYQGEEYCFVSFKSQKTDDEGNYPVSQLIYNTVMSMDDDRIFYNSKRGNVYSFMWVNDNLRKHFKKELNKAMTKGKTISAHSIRKTAGRKVYENGGLEVARKFLQHQRYDTTKDYLEIESEELKGDLIRIFHS